MNRSDLEATIRDALGKIAPDAATADIDPARNFRDQFDFDSVDFLNFALALEKALDRRIPELDFPRLSSLQGCLDYLSDPATGAGKAAG